MKWSSVSFTRPLAEEGNLMEHKRVWLTPLICRASEKGSRKKIGGLAENFKFCSYLYFVPTVGSDTMKLLWNLPWVCPHTQTHFCVNFFKKPLEARRTISLPQSNCFHGLHSQKVEINQYFMSPRINCFNLFLPWAFDQRMVLSES